MSRSRIGAVLAMAGLLAFSASPMGAEDLRVPVRDVGDLVTKTRPSLMSAIPGSTFVITVANLGGRRATVDDHCAGVVFSVDTILVNPNGGVEVEQGQTQKLPAGGSLQMVHRVDPKIGADRASIDLDQVGFRLRTEKSNRRCSLVGSAMFHATPNSLAPVPVSLIPSVERNAR